MLPTIAPGIKVAAQMSAEPSEDDLRWVKQMGVDYVVTWTDASKSSLDYYASRSKLFENFGLKIYGFGNRDVHNQDAIVLNLAGRDAKVEQYKRHLRDLGKAGIPYTTYAHMAKGIWSSGIPRCIFSSFDGYQQALDIAPSPNVGICFCVGCWLEGGPLMGKNVLESIHEFGRQGKIFKVHFRNVDAPLPHFVETFIDDGYMDMFKVMRALAAVNFDGVVIPDHIPTMAGDPKLGTAYTIGYMRALAQRANEEVAAARTLA